MIKASFVVAFLSLVISSCVPWTVRPIEKKEAGQSVTDPTAFSESLWNSKLAPAVLGSATPARALLDALAVSTDAAGRKHGRRETGGAWQFLVKGEGRALAVDRRSKSGLLLLDIAPFDGRADIAIQIGPVLRGTALRDATGLVNFADFVNQIQFADVANELNRRVLDKVLARVDFATIKGKTVSFAGAFSLEGEGDPPIRGLVPILLQVEGRP